MPFVAFQLEYIALPFLYLVPKFNFSSLLEGREGKGRAERGARRAGRGEGKGKGRGILAPTVISKSRRL